MLGYQADSPPVSERGGSAPNPSCILRRCKRRSTRPGWASRLYTELQIEAEVKSSVARRSGSLTK